MNKTSHPTIQNPTVAGAIRVIHNICAAHIDSCKDCPFYRPYGGFSTFTNQNVGECILQNHNPLDWEDLL